MDRRRNPFAAGAGLVPPFLAGRDAHVEQVTVALDRIRAGRSAKSVILYGLRGVGKTVLLNRFRMDAEARGITGIRIEAPEDRSLPALLIPPLYSALLRLCRGEAMNKNLLQCMRALASFASAIKVKYQDIEFNIDAEPLVGHADSGNLEFDLAALVHTIGKAARENDTAIVLFIYEMQYLPEDQLSSLISALHHASQDQMPVTMVGAGLPQLVGRTGKAKSYAERLFAFVQIGHLAEADARAALVVPARKESVEFACEAIDEILLQTGCYPYFLQEWGEHIWNIAEVSPIGLECARRTTKETIADLDASFFRVRFDRLTPTEKRYLRAMAELGQGPHRSGDIAEILGRKVTSVAPIRNALIGKGMIYSPVHGDTAFTVPLFDGFMKRAMPDL